MKTDSIFYRLFREFPGIFFELIGDVSTTASAYNFKSIEVKQEVEQQVKQSISRLLDMGLTPEQIAQGLDISVEVVRQVVQKDNSGS